MPTTRTRNRILVDLSQPFGIPVDLLATAADKLPRFARGYDAQFEIGLAEGAALQLDIAHLASITLEVKRARAGRLAPSAEDPVLMSQTLPAADLNQALTQNAWDSTAEADAHALFAFTAGQTANVPAQRVWLVVHALTVDAPARRILYLAALVDCQETGAPSSSAPEPPVDSYFTQAEADARFLLVDGDNNNFRIKSGTGIQIRETAPTPGWRTIWLQGGALKFGPLDET